MEYPSSKNICVRCSAAFDQFYIETSESKLGCHIYRLYSNGYCWCFCLDSLYKWIKISEEQDYASNPVTREPLNKTTVEDIKSEYKNVYGSGNLDDEKVDELMKDIVDMKISMAEKTSGKIPLSLVASHVLGLYKDVAELNDESWDELRWENIKTAALEKLAQQGRYV